MENLCTIRTTAKRLKDDGTPVAEYALRCWVKTGAIPSVRCGQKALLFYPNVLAYLRSGGASGGDTHGKNR